MRKKKMNEENSQSKMDNRDEITTQSTNISQEDDIEEQQQNEEKSGISIEEAYEKLLVKSNDYFEGWQRERADFLNYKKRIERDQISLKNYLVGEIVKKYIIILDDMELAIKNKPTDSNCEDWVEGIELIHQKLVSILDNEGVERIKTDGGFDPNIHEALTQIDSPAHESGQIVDVMRQGYKIGDRILRPSLVIVAR
ncbi:MAG: nucleotide exchange factor GrpE [Chloroflexi bacterium HGW-Chloroflexi-8]|nr:MAG: nucleotide exchange factor GrpE [Chloroflexi bacterium HGW-Chloroflexi-8]